MPSKSKAQHNFMAAVAHNPAFAKKVGVPKSVGEDYTEADKGRKFGKGGEMAKKPLFGGKETYAEELREAKAIKSGKISPQQYAKGEKSEESKMAKNKFAAGGMPSPREFGGRPAPMNRVRPQAQPVAPSTRPEPSTSPDPRNSTSPYPRNSASPPAQPMSQEQQLAQSRPAALRAAATNALMAQKSPNRPAAPSVAPRAYKKGGMAKGGFTRSADGVATKGKTKAAQVKMARGGKC